ncbi:MAG: (2Fe-2S) ferredoxin domain-containing protein [Anaerolineae bacterium]|jgi:(2Fe-2S) ferredoxin|nr:(2Fe-2S) ferredoxin domain-containing protein [Anaerolineae bacterium]
MSRPACRLVLCRGQYCNLDRRADTLHRLLTAALEPINGPADPPPVRLTTANCLSRCGAGPNAILHPGGRVFQHLDAATLGELLAALPAPADPAE